MLTVLTLTLIALTGPDGQTVWINPADVVSVREPRGEGHFDADVHCLLYTADSKFIAVTETCDQVRIRLKAEE
jgi:hypothetical protein